MSANLALLLAAGVAIACGVYLVLERTLTRILLGVILLGNGVNLLFLVAAGPAGPAPFGGSDGRTADPLPFAFVLTALVITLGVASFVLAVSYRSFQLFGHDEVQDDVEDRQISLRADRAARREAIEEARRRAREAYAQRAEDEGADRDAAARTAEDYAAGLSNADLLDDVDLESDVNSDDNELPGSESEADRDVDYGPDANAFRRRERTGGISAITVAVDAESEPLETLLAEERDSSDEIDTDERDAGGRRP